MKSNESWPAVGIDISKRKFDAALLRPEGKVRHRTFTNTTEGAEQICAWLAHHQIHKAHIVMEATGGYGDALLEYLYANPHFSHLPSHTSFLILAIHSIRALQACKYLRRGWMQAQQGLYGRYQRDEEAEFAFKTRVLVHASTVGPDLSYKGPSQTVYGQLESYIGINDFQARAKISWSGHPLDIAMYIRRAEIRTRAPIFSKRSLSVLA